MQVCGTVCGCCLLSNSEEVQGSAMVQQLPLSAALLEGSWPLPVVVGGWLPPLHDAQGAGGEEASCSS